MPEQEERHDDLDAAPFGAEFEIADPSDLLNPEGDAEDPTSLLEHADPRDLFAIPDTAILRFSDQATNEAAKTKANRGRSIRRRFVRPENASLLVQALPEPGDTTHAILRGDFILGDLIPPMLDHYGPATTLIVATLGMSARQADQLATLIDTGKASQIRLILSHYFANVDRSGIYAEVLDRIEATRRRTTPDTIRVAVARTHAKILAFQTRDGRHSPVVETSANLRSCDALEQLTALNDPALYGFHEAWTAQLLTRYEVKAGTKAVPKDQRRI